MLLLDCDGAEEVADPTAITKGTTAGQATAFSVRDGTEWAVRLGQGGGDWGKAGGLELSNEGSRERRCWNHTSFNGAPLLRSSYFLFFRAILPLCVMFMLASYPGWACLYVSGGDDKGRGWGGEGGIPKGPPWDTACVMQRRIYFWVECLLT